MAQITGGEAVVRALKAEGVEVVFGIPGVHALPIYDALYHHPEIRHISTRHEQAAAYMADGYARVTGKPGVCITTTGPGAANSIAAMGTAYNDSSPVLNIMSQIATDLVDKWKGALHDNKDQLGLFKACTRWNTRVSAQAEIPAAIHEAFRQMMSGHPGPTAVEICSDVLADAVDLELFKFAENVKYERSPGDRIKIAQAAEALHKASLPVIWAGGGAVTAGAFKEVLRLAELLGAPVLTTIGGKSVIPEDHPLCIGNRAGEPGVKKLLAEADVMLAVGTRFTANATINWSVKMPRQLIQVDVDEGEIGRNYPAALGIVGDAKAVLSQILEAIEGNAVNRESLAARIVEIKQQSIEFLHQRGSTELEMMETLRDCLPRDAITVWDLTMPAYWSSRAFPVFEPRSFLYPVGYATLGFGFPAALGAKVGALDKKVVAITGDGGFQFCLQDLATAVQFDINVTILVFNDSHWGVLREMQDLNYGGRRYMVDIRNPDFVKLAEAYGANGLRVNNPSEFRPVLEQALSADKVTVVDIPMEFRRPWIKV